MSVQSQATEGDQTSQTNGTAAAEGTGRTDAGPAESVLLFLKEIMRDREQRGQELAEERRQREEDRRVQEQRMRLEQERLREAAAKREEESQRQLGVLKSLMEEIHDQGIASAKRGDKEVRVAKLTDEDDI